MSKAMIAPMVAGAALLGMSSTAIAAPAVAVGNAPAGETPLAAAAEEQTSQIVAVANVQGTFGYDQQTVTPNATIKDVFQKATATLCNIMGAQRNFSESFLISVGGEVPVPFTATLGQIEQEQGSTVQLMGCSCTSNSAGGWAVANARVKGVSVEAIAAQAGL